MLLSAVTVESFGDSVDLVRERFEVGVRPALDVRLAMLNLSNARSQLSQRRQQLDASTRQLEVLLAQYAGGGIAPPADLPDMPPAVPGGVPANLVARGPDLVAGERQVAASEARLRVARRELLPTFNLTVNTGTATDSLRTLLSGNFAVWSLVGNVVAPLWQGGRLRAQVSRAEAQVAEVLGQLREHGPHGLLRGRDGAGSRGALGRTGRSSGGFGRTGAGRGTSGGRALPRRTRRVHHRPRLATVRVPGRIGADRGAAAASREPRGPLPRPRRGVRAARVAGHADESRRRRLNRFPSSGDALQ